MGISQGLGSQALLPAGLGFRNVIINGDFQVNQRNVTNQTTAGGFGHDRWRIYGSGGISYAPTAFTAGGQPYGSSHSSSFARVTSSSQTTSAHHCVIAQAIEDVNTLADSVCTISFFAKASSGTPKVGIEMRQNFGSGGSTQVHLPAGSVQLSTSWQRYSVQVYMPSLVGKTIGTSSYVLLLLWTSAGSDNATFSSNIGLQNTTIDFFAVQVEENTYATPFEQRPLAVELPLCMRYYERTYDLGVANGTATYTGIKSWIASGLDGLCGASYCWVVPKRSAPGITVYSSDGLAGYINMYGYGNVLVNSVSSTRFGLGSMSIAVNNVMGRPGFCHIVADAEL